MAALTKRQQTALKRHSVHHTAKHMTEMRKMMRSVKSGDNPRRASFLARMGAGRGSDYKDGEPTRKLLALRKWGASSSADAIKKAKAISKRNKNKEKA